MGGTPDQTYAEVVLGRRSIRGYLKKPVPRALIEEVLTLAMRSPSSMNTQPYHFHVITGEPLDRIRAGAERRVGLGRANDRWFLANAGLGIDAEIIAAMERHRKAGRTATPTRYFTTTLNAFFRGTDRKQPALTLTRPDPASHEVERLEGVFFAIVQNTSPWTYFGTLPVNPCPAASFDTGLDLFSLRRMRVPTALVAAQRMLTSRTGGSARGGIVSWHDQSAFTLTANRPVAVQIDGEGVGDATEVVFASHPGALRVVR